VDPVQELRQELYQYAAPGTNRYEIDITHTQFGYILDVRVVSEGGKVISHARKEVHR
jgi:hypothetical protein